MKRTIAIIINVIILLLLVIYSMYYLFGDCFDDAKINHFFILQVAFILTASAGLAILLLNPPKKSNKTVNTTHNSIAKNKMKKNT